MFMNSNSLPIALMQSLVVTVPGLKWGDDDSEDAMVGRALTYLVLYSTLGMVVSLSSSLPLSAVCSRAYQVRWSYGVRLLSQADPETTSDGQLVPPDEPLIGREEDAFPASSEEYRRLHHDHSDSSTVTHDAEYPRISVEDTDRANSDPKFFYSFPNSPYTRSKNLTPNATSSVISAPSTDAGDEEDDDALEFPARRQVTEPTSSVWQSRRRKLGHRIKKFFHSLYEFMTVPLWAALLSLAVACTPPLQHALDEHVQPIKGAIAQAGNCSIPITLVVLGAYFYAAPDPEAARSRAALPTTTGAHAERGRSVSTSWSQLSLVDNVREMFKMKRRSFSAARRGDKKRPGETKTIVIAILARMIITPLLLLPVFALSTRFNLQEVFDE